MAPSRPLFLEGYENPVSRQLNERSTALNVEAYDLQGNPVSFTPRKPHWAERLVHFLGRIFR